MPMAEKENCPPRFTRAAAKRAAAASLVDVSEENLAPAKRKRVALSELPTLSNAVFVPPPPPPAKAKPARSKPKKMVLVKKAVSTVDLTSADAESKVDDPQMCSQYSSDIYEYIRSMEVQPKRRCSSDYIETVQTDVTANMRAILVDWLVEVAEEYKLVSDTLFLTVSYIDRFLSHNSIARQKLQLLGVSAMLIASKYEEITPPRVEDFCYITDNTYTKQEVVKMESDILKFLNFEMGNPTIKTFLRQFINAGQEDDKYSNLQLEFMASYLSELCLIDYGCVGFLPSVLASSAVFVARFTINPKFHPWNKKLQDSTGYTVSELKKCILSIRDLQLKRKFSASVAIRDKYKQHRFKCVSALQPPSEIPMNYLENLKES